MNPLRVGLPESLWLVRHGESEGNVANALARQNHASRLDLTVNDPEVSLSETGRSQAAALGAWIATVPEERQPTAVVVSPYVRALETAEIVLAEAGLGGLPRSCDERLRDREQGVLDRLTGKGFRAEYPDEADRRDYLGKFWYRPMGGESWADVALRIRAALLEIRLNSPDERVLIVSHDVPILVLRYILEQLTAADVVELSGQVQNCSLTEYRREDDRLVLTAFSDTTALEQDAEAPVTAHE